MCLLKRMQLRMDKGQANAKSSNNTSDPSEVDLSALQSMLKGECRANVMLILDVCHSGYQGSELLGSRAQQNHIMETLAACDFASQPLLAAMRTSHYAS